MPEKQTDIPSPTHETDTPVRVGGDLKQAFNAEDYLAMLNPLDEASVALRIHTILEEFLNIWCDRVTGTNRLFGETFVPFKKKLAIAQDLGFAAEYADIFDKFNEIRNSYSHKRKYARERETLNLIKDKVNALSAPMPPCEGPSICEAPNISDEETDQFGQAQKIQSEWASSDIKKKLLLVFIPLVMKLTQWMQIEFARRGIEYAPVVPDGMGNDTPEA